MSTNLLSLYIIPFPEATVHHGLSVLQVPGAMGLDVEDRNQCLVCQRSFLSLTTCLMWKWSFVDTLQNVTTVNEVGKTWMQERKGRGHRKDGQGQGLRDQGSLKTLHFFFPSWELLEVLTERHDQDSAQEDHLQWRIAEEIDTLFKKSVLDIQCKLCLKVYAT